MSYSPGQTSIQWVILQVKSQIFNANSHRHNINCRVPHQKPPGQLATCFFLSPQLPMIKFLEFVIALHWKYFVLNMSIFSKLKTNVLYSWKIFTCRNITSTINYRGFLDFRNHKVSNYKYQNANTKISKS